MPIIYYTPKDVEHIARTAVQLGRYACSYVNLGWIGRDDVVRDMINFREIFEPFLRNRIADSEEKAKRYYELCLEDLLRAGQSS